MGWFEPGPSTKIPPKSVTLTDTTYPIHKNLVPAILSLSGLAWERDIGTPCSMRKSLEKSGYMVEPPFIGREKVVK